MARPKPWQILLIVAAIAVLGLGIWMSTRGGPARVPSRFPVIDLATGKMYDFPAKNGGGFPERSPETGEATVLPVYKEDGVYFIDEIFRGSIRDMGEIKSGVYDARTGRVTPASDSMPRFPR